MACTTALEVNALLATMAARQLPAAIAALEPHPAPPPPTPDDGCPHLVPAGSHDPAKAARMFRL